LSRFEKNDRLEGPCPRCDGVLVVRQNKAEGNLFVGCWNFVDGDCRFSRQVDEDNDVVMAAPKSQPGVHPAVQPNVDELPADDDGDPFLDPPDHSEMATRVRDGTDDPLSELARLIAPEHDGPTIEATKNLLCRVIGKLVDEITVELPTTDQVTDIACRAVELKLEQLGNDHRLRAKDDHCGHVHQVVLLKGD